jgi:hypothetical protein
MNKQLGHGIAVTLVLLVGCGSGGSGTTNAANGGSGDHAGTAGGVSGSAGGEPAAGGATGYGSAGAGTAGGRAGAGTAGAGTAGGGWAGASGGAGATAGAGPVDGGGTTWLTPPVVPPALAVPEGAAVALHAHAVGAQIYTCTASGGVDAGVDAGAVAYAWVLKAPDAKLYDSTGAQIGTHGAGPSWTANDGSVAHGTKVAELDAPSPDAITWLLLRVASTTGAGTFSDVTYVQRVNTVGGRAPATGCDSTAVGTDARASYSADYYFFAGGGAAAWLTAPQVPDAIAVPTYARLKLHDHAIGVQIYNCAASGGAGATTYAWVFRAPDALLFDMTFVPVAMHGAGPSWTSNDGSSVIAPEIARVASPRPDAIPWLLLKELSTTGPGVFSDIAFVQRLNTAGGQAPATGCDATTVNTETRVQYSADYYFYDAAEIADAAAGPG